MERPLAAEKHASPAGAKTGARPEARISPKAQPQSQAAPAQPTARQEHAAPQQHAATATRRHSNTPRLRKGPLSRMGPCQRACSAEAWLLRTEARGQPWASVLSSQTTLRQFRQILQIVMGSKNYHLLESLVSETRYEVPDPGSYHGRLKSKCRTRPRCFRLGTSFWSPTREDGSLFRPLQCGSQAGIDGATAHMVRRC